MSRYHGGPVTAGATVGSTGGLSRSGAVGGTGRDCEHASPAITPPTSATATNSRRELNTSTSASGLAFQCPRALQLDLDLVEAVLELLRLLGVAGHRHAPAHGEVGHRVVGAELERLPQPRLALGRLTGVQFQKPAL